MTIHRKFIGAVLAACVLLALPAAAAPKNSALLSLSMEHFRDTAVVSDNPQNGVVTISTENGYQERQGPMRTVWDDEYLVAAIDGNTGQKSFLVYVWITYTGNLRSYRSASYQAAEGTRSVPVTQGPQEKSLCAVGDCTYTEHLSFPVDENLLRSVAAASASGQPTPWSFSLGAKSGPGYRGELSSAEIGGLLARLDGYKNEVRAAAPGPAGASIAAAAALKRDFGVGGMAVDAAAEQPNRAGVLIYAVAGGSVAHKAGIIVGDILYEFGGHPMSTPAELQAAVAACAANTSVAVKLYRGTTAMTVTAGF